jgi:phosphopantothenoylcysteine decarboxylase/phosphopantothenate--cysteine ligase
MSGGFQDGSKLFFPNKQAGNLKPARDWLASFCIDIIIVNRKKVLVMYKMQETINMEKKNILLCVTGGIAAFKAIDLASKLVKEGFDVKTILTKHALEFVTELNFKAITKNTTHTEMFAYSDPIPHISLADWADLIVVAPATANMMAKAVHGNADDLMSTVLLAHTKPVLWVPAMNVHMWNHPATQDNLKTLLKRGNYVLEPVTGMLACGYEGKGKFPPVDEVLYAIQVYVHHAQDFKGKKVLITTGGTEEPIDAMRVISNRSSGKMGMALARAAVLRGAEVHLVYGNVTVEIPYYLASAVSTPSVSEMKKAVDKLAPRMDIIIMAAAVSDFTLAHPVSQKIKKSAKLSLDLVQTPDILAGLGKAKKPKQKLIGFAAETENVIANAKEKLKKKTLDMIVANHLQVSGMDNTEITIITQNSEEEFRACKLHAASIILDKIKAL